MSYQLNIRREITFVCIAIVAPLVAGVASQLHYSGVLIDRRSHAFFTLAAVLIGCVALWCSLDCRYSLRVAAILAYIILSWGMVAVTTLTVASSNGDSL